jgi:hypothetical protein
MSTFGRDGELSEGPRLRLAQEFDLGVALGLPQRDRCDHASIELSHESVA